MEYLGFKTKIKSFLGGRANLVIKDEQGKIVDSNFLGGEEEFKDFVLMNKYKLYCDILDSRFSDIFTFKNDKIYLEEDCIGKMSQKYFEFNGHISYSLREKLQKVFKDIRDYQEDYQSRRKIQEEDIKKELEERILNNLEK